jgi:omega-amidase
MNTVSIALAQFDTGWHDPPAVLRKVREHAARAARNGARLMVLPEMSTTGFTMDNSQAEPLDGPSARGIAAIAADSGINILAGLATRERNGDRDRHFNSAMLFSTDGRMTSEYRKQKLFAFAGEDESYERGHSPSVFEIDGVRMAPFICYDLRFPELFRAVAPSSDVLILIANWPARRRDHWDVMVRARAIENLAYMVAVNRTGEGGGIAYDGGSAVYSPWGELIISAGCALDSTTVVEVSAARVAAVRAEYPFLSDMTVPAEASTGAV